MQHRNEIRAACASTQYSEEGLGHMSTQQTFVIVGAGLAGAKAAEALRTNGFDGNVILIGDEAERPYDRPPAVEGLPAGQHRAGKDLHPSRAVAPRTRHRPASGHTSHRNRLRCPRSEHSARRDAGLRQAAPDDRFFAPAPEVPGADLAGVHYLRRVADSEALQAAFASAQRVAIIGAGWIGWRQRPPPGPRGAM